MKKSDLKQFMLVQTGYNSDFYIVLEDKNEDFFLFRTPTEKELEEDENADPDVFLSCEFDDNLVCIEYKEHSIVSVYDSIPVDFPLKIYSVEDLYNKYKPTLLWKRECSPISISKIKSFKDDEDRMNYINSIVPPYIAVE